MPPSVSCQLKHDVDPRSIQLKISFESYALQCIHVPQTHSVALFQKLLIYHCSKILQDVVLSALLSLHLDAALL